MRVDGWRVYGLAIGLGADMRNFTGNNCLQGLRIPGKGGHQSHHVVSNEQKNNDSWFETARCLFPSLCGYGEKVVFLMHLCPGKA